MDWTCDSTLKNWGQSAKIPSNELETVQAGVAEVAGLMDFNFQLFYIDFHWVYMRDSRVFQGYHTAKSAPLCQCWIFTERCRLFQLGVVVSQKYRGLTILMLVSNSVHAGCGAIYLYYIQGHFGKDLKDIAPIIMLNGINNLLVQIFVVKYLARCLSVRGIILLGYVFGALNCCTFEFRFEFLLSLHHGSDFWPRCDFRSSDSSTVYELRSTWRDGKSPRSCEFCCDDYSWTWSKDFSPSVSCMSDIQSSFNLERFLEWIRVKLLVVACGCLWLLVGEEFVWCRDVYGDCWPQQRTISRFFVSLFFSPVFLSICFSCAFNW